MCRVSCVWCVLCRKRTLTLNLQFSCVVIALSLSISLCGVIGEACRDIRHDAVLVDVGAGEGYLSSALATLLRLPLVGIDCSQSNVQGTRVLSVVQC